MHVLAATFLLVMGSSALAQEPHIHRQTVPDWYDPNCCSDKDCKPVEDDSDIEFGKDQFDNTWARYKPTGHTFYKHQFKLSQDERYHVCINPAAAGNNGALCFYDRTGA